MKSRLLLNLALAASLVATPVLAQGAIPHLEKRGQATQLIVDGKPFLARAGELRNSSATSRAYMAPLWSRLNQANINLVLAAVPWNVVERQEGRYDFTVVDELIADARTNNQRLVLLWFGSWKNGLSHYAPEWVKRDTTRFPRILTRTGAVEVLTPTSDANLEADAKAFAALMRHVKATDGARQTVVMIQVENEVGLIGDTRDRSLVAERAYASQVPTELLAALQLNRDRLNDKVRGAWASSGFRASGSWVEVFGRSPAADEVFMAYHYARYLDRVTAAGKREYALPMFVNAWIVQPEDEVPGDYPGGGPQAHSLDIWRATAKSVDIFTPDIYLPNFNEVAGQYAKAGEAFFVPESRNGLEGAANAFVAIGRYNSIGYSPFGVPGADEATNPLSAAYGVLRDIAPLVLDAQAKGTISAVSLDNNNTVEEITLGGYRLQLRRPQARNAGGGNGASAASNERGYAMVIATGPDEFLIAGSNVHVTFATAAGENEVVGIADLEEGVYANGAWKPGRNLNGDEIMISYDQGAMASQRQTGTGAKFGSSGPTLQKVRLYRFPHGK